MFTASSSHTQSLLSTFPYHQNYIDLSRLECSILESFLPVHAPETRPSPSKIAFIGSGPLPFTSFCVLDRYPNAIVHNVDRDTSALQISERLASKLGYGKKMSFLSEDVSVEQSDAVSNGEKFKEEKTNWKEYQVVFLAALVGMNTSAKLAILTSLAAKLEPGTLVVARSARGLRTLLYPVRYNNYH
jgi:nicotianamine synthase